ncbi:hypothetical protein [Desertivibrio insolitus]|uniref:hypothetical protein n=1 Tax=Herbiconiux sp. SYSU D00978 TaxID=2812562 RepID=UPI001A95C051|nr:hypothetical protein [Herbiconiux sp. SYSU D00978]
MTTGESGPAPDSGSGSGSGSADPAVVIPVDAARAERALVLTRRMLIAIPVIALAVVVVVALLQPRLSLVLLTAAFVGVLALVALQAVRRRRRVERAADDAGVAFALDDRGLYVASLATTIAWQEITGVVHWNQTERVRRGTSRGVWGVGPRFVAGTGGHSHHVTIGVRDGAALRERMPRGAQSAVKPGRKSVGGTVVLLPDVALAPDGAALLLSQLRARAESRGISFTTATSALDWASAAATLELAS